MQVSPSVHALKIPFQIPAAPDKAVNRYVYVYLVLGRRVVLVDSGVAGTEYVIRDYLRRLGRRPEEIAAVVQTHAHPDHIGATRAIKAMSGCAVAAHAQAKAWIEDTERQRRERPVPGFKRLVGGSVGVDRDLAEGDLVELGDGRRLEVYYTPGHSPDSLSLLLREEGVLIAGDAVPVAREAPIYDDYPASVASLKRLMSFEGIQCLLSSWDEPRRGEAARAAMSEGLRHLERFYAAVRAAAADSPGADPAELCSRVLSETGLAPAAVNPLVCRSVAASLRTLGGDL